MYKIWHLLRYWMTINLRASFGKLFASLLWVEVAYGYQMVPHYRKFKNDDKHHLNCLNLWNLLSNVTMAYLPVSVGSLFRPEPGSFLTWWNLSAHVKLVYGPVFFWIGISAKCNTTGKAFVLVVALCNTCKPWTMLNFIAILVCFYAIQTSLPVTFLFCGSWNTNWWIWSSPFSTWRCRYWRISWCWWFSCLSILFWGIQREMGKHFYVENVL